jgi:phenylalanyl-tRNA synthetase beta chain
VRFSHAWLKTYVTLEEDPAAVGRRLTAAGIPLDGIEGTGDQAVYDFDVFANRPDCMNHLGIAREYAALTGAALKRPSADVPRGGQPTADQTTVTIEAPELCARYAARCVSGVRIAPSPEWLRRSLESIGQRSINNVVDATNFVLWEMGHPLHPFDLDRLEGRRIVVRRARPGETLTTLDGVERRLTPDILVIADARRPVAIAGIMGGEETGVTGGTRTVLLESAWFDPVSVRLTARALALHTDASHRFERGADPEGLVRALDRASCLIAETAGGTVSDPRLDVYPRPLPPRAIRFRPGRARALLGLRIEEAAMKETLTRLEFAVSEPVPEEWQVTVPPFRRDVEREVDLIEEVARHRGYDAIPAARPQLPDAGEGRSDPDRALTSIRRALQSAGLSEAMNYSMVEREDCTLFDPSLDSPLSIDNPLQSQAAFLRSSLLPGLLRNVLHNLNHGAPACHLFEIGTAFRPRHDLPEERTLIAFVLAGRGLPAHWSLPRRDTDLYDARGVIEVVAELLGLSPLTFSSDRIPFLAPGRSLGVRKEGRILGVAGEIAPRILERYEINRPVFGGEFALGDLLRDRPGVRRYVPFPRFPAVRRDLALVVAKSKTFEAIGEVVRKVSTLPIADVQPFDRYEGPGLPEGCVSLAVQVVFQHPDRTLAAAEVEKTQEAIVAALQRELGARLRGPRVE